MQHPLNYFSYVFHNLEVVLQCTVKITFLFSVSDGWSFENNIDIKKHKSLEDRLSAAQILLQKEPLCTVVVDEMDNAAAIKYGALPERLYVLQAGKVVYKVRSLKQKQMFILLFYV